MEKVSLDAEKLLFHLPFFLWNCESMGNPLIHENCCNFMMSAAPALSYIVLLHCLRVGDRRTSELKGMVSE